MQKNVWWCMGYQKKKKIRSISYALVFIGMVYALPVFSSTTEVSAMKVDTLESAQPAKEWKRLTLDDKRSNVYLLDLSTKKDDEIIDSLSRFTIEYVTHRQSPGTLLLLLDPTRASEDLLQNKLFEFSKRKNWLRQQWHLITIITQNTTLTENFSSIFENLHNKCPSALISKPSCESDCLECDLFHLELTLHHDGNLHFENFQHVLKTHFSDVQAIDHSAALEYFVEQSRIEIDLQPVQKNSTQQL